MTTTRMAKDREHSAQQTGIDKEKVIKMIKKSLAIILCCLSCLYLTSCGKKSDPVFIDPPPLPDYSSYIKLADYKGLEYELKNDYTITDDDIKEALEDKLAAAAEFEETETGAEYGNIIQLMYTGTVNGKTFDGGSTGSDGNVIRLGSAGYVDGFEEQIKGMKKNETKTIKVTFPEDYGKPELNGKEAEFTVTVLTVMIVKMPEITDALVKRYTDYKSVADAEMDIESILSENAAEAKNNEIYNTVIQQIITKSEYTGYPDGEIDSLIKTAVSAAERNAALENISVDDYIAKNHPAENLADFKQIMSEQAKDYMNIRMTLSEIARRENITATPEEFTKYKSEFAANNGFENIRDVNLYYKDEDLLIDCIYEKIRDWIITNSKERR